MSSRSSKKVAVKRPFRSDLSSSLITSMLPTGIAVLVTGFALSRLRASNASKINELDANSVAALDNIQRVKGQIARIVGDSGNFNNIIKRRKSKELMAKLQRNVPHSEEIKREVSASLLEDTKDLLDILTRYNEKKASANKPISTSD